MSQREDLERQIQAHQRRLQVLRERKAQQGVETPAGIILEIEDIEIKLATLEAELQNLPTNTIIPPLQPTQAKIILPIAAIVGLVVCGFLLFAIATFPPAAIGLFAGAPTPTVTPSATTTASATIVPTLIPSDTPTDTPTNTPPTPTWTPEATDIPAPTTTNTAIATPTVPVPTNTPTPLCQGTPEYFSVEWQKYPKLGCPENAMLTGFTYQEFDNGLLTWIENTREIFAFFESDGHWEPYEDTFDKDIDSHCAPTANPSLTFAFGELYCHNPTIRDKLGEPVANAEPIKKFFVPQNNDRGNVVQNFENGMVVWVTSRRIFIIYLDKTWQEVSN